jgi:hypothetical protein
MTTTPAYPAHEEPPLTIAVLDYQKEETTEACLRSIRAHVQVPYRLVYLHNGRADYPRRFLDIDLIDTLIQPSTNRGLGIGTRDLMAAVFSPYVIMWQNDQLMGRALTRYGWAELVGTLDERWQYGMRSISLAGPVCDTPTERHVYSERAHLTKTAFYREMEHTLPLSYGGAGPYHHAQWREGQIQEHYRQQGYLHYTDWPPLALDNGREARRSNPDGSEWLHYPDTKQLWLVSGPVKERYVYPYLSDTEWDTVLATQAWPPGQIPERERGASFHVWH